MGFFTRVADSWTGITVNGSNRVTNIELNFMSLGGFIAPQLGELSSLDILHLSDNNLSGAIPSELGNLSALTQLHIDNNLLSDSIPSELGNLSASLLTNFLLNNNQLSGTIPSSLSNLSSLEFLYLNDNQLSDSIPPELGSLSALQYVHIDNNQLSGEIPEGFKSIADFSRSRLRLADNHFSPDDMASFTEGYGTNSNGWGVSKRIFPVFTVSPQTPPHPDLRDDTLYFSPVDPYIDGLVYNGDTYTAEYEFNPSTATAMTQGFSRLSTPIEDSYALTTTLTGSYASPANVLVFTDNVMVVEDSVGLDGNNKPVDIVQCELYIPEDDRGPLCYQYFAFSDSSNKLTELSSWDFLQAVTDNWRGITVNDSNRVILLRLLNINLEGSIVPQLGELSFLDELHLSSNDLSGMIPSELGNLLSLTSLLLDNNQLSGPIPSSLGNLLSLTSLLLDNNQLSGPIPSSLGNLLSLTSLLLDNNQLSGSIPSSLGCFN